MRSALKILAIIGAIISAPLIFFGWGLFITVPLVVLVIALDRKPAEPTTTGVSPFWSIMAIVVGLAIFFGGYVLGSFGNIDTTGKPNNSGLVVSAILGLVAGIMVYSIGKKRS